MIKIIIIIQLFNIFKLKFFNLGLENNEQIR